MWLCTQHGFFSIVQKKPGEFHVRARLKRDLENLLDVVREKMGPAAKRTKGPKPTWKIHESLDADYRWRIVCKQCDVILILAAMADAIDYSNFKSRIHDLEDQREKAADYAVLWKGLYLLQQKGMKVRRMDRQQLAVKIAGVAMNVLFYPADGYFLMPSRLWKPEMLLQSVLLDGANYTITEMRVDDSTLAKVIVQENVPEHREYKAGP
jgi:hypothetical protein